MDRREFVRLLIGGGVTVLGSQEPWERLSWALERSGTADARVADDLEAVTVSLSRLERDVASPRTLLPLASGHLDTIATLLQGSVQPVVRARLCSLAAETAGLVGWLRWDLGDLAGAGGYFRAGLQAAVQGGDKPLAAYLMGSMAYRPMYLERPDIRLARLAGSAHGVTVDDATPHTQAWLCVLAGGAHAMLGLTAEFDLAMDQAAELLVFGEDDEEARRPRVPFFNPVYLAEEKAAGLLRLGMPAAAREVLLSVLPQGYGRMAHWLQVDLASAAAAEGEPELAAHHGMLALAGAREGAVEPVLECVRRLAEELRPESHLAPVRELQDAAALV